VKALDLNAFGDARRDGRGLAVETRHLAAEHRAIPIGGELGHELARIAAASSVNAQSSSMIRSRSTPSDKARQMTCRCDSPHAHSAGSSLPHHGGGLTLRASMAGKSWTPVCSTYQSQSTASAGYSIEHLVELLDPVQSDDDAAVKMLPHLGQDGVHAGLFARTITP
jgi:hypothetical protein